MDYLIEVELFRSNLNKFKQNFFVDVIEQRED